MHHRKRSLRLGWAWVACAGFIGEPLCAVDVLWLHAAVVSGVAIGSHRLLFADEAWARECKARSAPGDATKKVTARRAVSRSSAVQRASLCLQPDLVWAERQ